MRYFLILFSISILLFQSCSKESNKETEKPKKKVVSKHKDIKPQEPPPREIIDINEEGYSVEEVREIDKEIPVLEIIAGKNWTQSELDKLSGMEMLDTLRLENMDLSSVNFDFAKSLKALKKISVKGSNVSGDSISKLVETLPNLDIEK